MVSERTCHIKTIFWLKESNTLESVLLYSGIEASDSFAISFVIPTFKRTKLLVSAIDSILNQRNLERTTFEIIVVNNNPSDNMKELIEKYRGEKISFYKNIKNYGQVGNINRGIELSRGKYVSFLHDDDLLLENYLDVIFPYISCEKHFDCLVPSQYSVLKNYKFDFKHVLINIALFPRFFYRGHQKNINHKDCLFSFRDVYNPPTCGVIFSKESLDGFGYFKECNGAAWDFYNFREYNKKYKVVLLHKKLGARRIYTGMSNKKEVFDDFLEDEKWIVRHNKNNSFIKKYGEAMIQRKGLKYIAGKILSSLYFYLHNLDGISIAPKRIYHIITKGD